MFLVGFADLFQLDRDINVPSDSSSEDEDEDEDGGDDDELCVG
jgi:hypothetical protein